MSKYLLIYSRLLGIRETSWANQSRASNVFEVLASFSSLVRVLSHRAKGDSTGQDIHREGAVTLDCRYMAHIFQMQV